MLNSSQERTVHEVLATIAELRLKAEEAQHSVTAWSIKFREISRELDRCYHVLHDMLHEHRKENGSLKAPGKATTIVPDPQEPGVD
jgi:hypothetical protein